MKPLSGPTVSRPVWLGHHADAGMDATSRRFDPRSRLTTTALGLAYAALGLPAAFPSNLHRVLYLRASLCTDGGAEDLVADQLGRLCVISRDRLLGGDFITALQASLGPGERLEIIKDRRHPGSSGMPDLDVDRRRLHQVDLALEASGFAIVPTSADRIGNGTPPSQPPSETPIEQPSPEIEQPSPEEDEEPVESVGNSRVRPSDTVIRILGVLSGLTMTALLVLLAGWVTEHNLVGQLFTESLWMSSGQPAGQTNKSFTAGQSSPAAEMTAGRETPAEGTSRFRPDRESTRPDGPTRTNSVSTLDRDPLTLGHRETNGPSEATATVRQGRRATAGDTVARPEDAGRSSRVAGAPADETDAPAKARADQGPSGGRPRLSATARAAPRASVKSEQVTGVRSAETATPDATPPRSEDPLRAKLVQGPVSRGWGDSYSVRLLTSTGQPVKVFGVTLVAHKADGSVEKIAMGALPELGMYRGTVPTGRASTVELRIRVHSGDKFVEIPLTP